MTRLHLDTDFAGNPDDACALAMLLGWPDVEITAITTVADPGGQRAGYVHHFLRLAGRDDIPVAAGAERSGTTGLPMGDLPDAARYWGEPVPAVPSLPDAAVDLLDRSIAAGAAVAAIGPVTNLAALELARPGRLASTAVYAMGGWLDPLDADLPAWGPERDWNVQCDTAAASTILGCSDVTWVPLAVTVRAQLCAGHLPRLRAAGPLGRLLARQALAFAADRELRALTKTSPGLAPDVQLLLHDPLTCAVALGWPGASVEPMRLRPVRDGHVLRFQRDEGGQPHHVVTTVDADAFVETWLDRIAALRDR